jgi:hypothetical protein
LSNVIGLSNLLFFMIILIFIYKVFVVQIVQRDIPSEIDGNTTQISFYTIFNSFWGMLSDFFKRKLDQYSLHGIFCAKKIWSGIDQRSICFFLAS